jgi:hypothetical protein
MRPLGRRILCCVASLLVSSLESAWASSQAAGGGVGGAFRLPSAIVGIEASVEQMEKLYLAQGAYKEAAKYEKLRKNLDELRLLPSSDGSVKGQLENEVASQLINLQRELIVDHATVTAVRQQNEGGDVAFVKLAEQTEKMTQVNGLAARMYKGVYYILWAVGLMSLGTALVLFGDSAVQHLGNTKEVSDRTKNPVCMRITDRCLQTLRLMWPKIQRMKQVVFWGMQAARLKFLFLSWLDGLVLTRLWWI